VPKLGERRRCGVRGGAAREAAVFRSHYTAPVTMCHSCDAAYTFDGDSLMSVEGSNLSDLAFEMELAADEALGPLSSSEFLPLYDSDFLPEVALAEHRDCEGVAMCLRRGADLERSPTDVMSTFSSMGEELRALQRGKLQRDMSDCCVGRTPPVL
jgi:hypothetical protein